MEFSNFLNKAGLLRFVKKTQDRAVNLNAFVKESFSLHKKLGEDYSGKIYRYKVPKLSPDGSCSIGSELEDQPYDLSQVFEINSKNSLWLWRLNHLVSTLQQKTGVDWLGIYKKIETSDGFLVKLAYFGAPSRAEFPLTEKFASHSNNSTVGLTGRAVLVQDVADYKGPYYKCDAKVKSEFCCPIFDRDGKIIGIIDAESFTTKFFDDEKVRQIAKVCFDLGAFL